MATWLIQLGSRVLPSCCSICLKTVDFSNRPRVMQILDRKQTCRTAPAEGWLKYPCSFAIAIIILFTMKLSACLRNLSSIFRFQELTQVTLKVIRVAKGRLENEITASGRCSAGKELWIRGPHGTWECTWQKIGHHGNIWAVGDRELKCATQNRSGLIEKHCL